MTTGLRLPSPIRVFAALSYVAVLLGAAMPAGAATGASEEIPFSGALLWKVERDGARPSYIFGTMHVNDERITNLPAPVRKAFASTRSLSLEIFMGADMSARLSRFLLGGRGRSVESLVSDADLERLIVIGAEYGLKGWHVRVIKARAMWWLLQRLPGEVKNEVAKAVDKQNGAPETDEPEAEAAFLDQALQEAAVARGMRVYGIETIEEHLGLFDQLSPREQGQLLGVAARTWQGEAADLEPLIQLYLARDTAAIHTRSRELIRADPTGATGRYYDLLLDARNRNMVQRLLDRLQAGGAFVAVGAAHLPGHNGVLRLLKSYGFRVTKVY